MHYSLVPTAIVTTKLTKSYLKNLKPFVAVPG